MNHNLQELLFIFLCVLVILSLFWVTVLQFQELLTSSLVSTIQLSSGKMTNSHWNGLKAEAMHHTTSGSSAALSLVLDSESSY